MPYTPSEVDMRHNEHIIQNRRPRPPTTHHPSNVQQWNDFTREEEFSRETLQEDFARSEKFCEKAKILREVKDFARRRFHKKKILREEDFTRKKFHEKEISCEDPGDWNRLMIQFSRVINQTRLRACKSSSKAVVLAFSLVHQLIFWVRACVRA